VVAKVRGRKRLRKQKNCRGKEVMENMKERNWKGNLEGYRLNKRYRWNWV